MTTTIPTPEDVDIYNKNKYKKQSEELIHTITEHLNIGERTFYLDRKYSTVGVLDPVVSILRARGWGGIWVERVNDVVSSFFIYHVGCYPGNPNCES